MNYLITSLQENEKFKEVVENVNEKISPIAISGLSDVSKVSIISSILESTKRKICVLTYNEIQAKKLVKDLKYFFKQVYFLPKREIAPYDSLKLQQSVWKWMPHTPSMPDNPHPKLPHFAQDN